MTRRRPKSILERLGDFILQFSEAPDICLEYNGCRCQTLNARRLPDALAIGVSSINTGNTESAANTANNTANTADATDTVNRTTGPKGEKMLVNGSCHCGAIRFEAEVDPKRVGICHCADCQTFSGGPYRTSVLVGGDKFRLLEGTPGLYGKTAESGSKREMAFCANCGTHVWGTSRGGEQTFYSVRVGTLKQRAELPPVAQVWCRSKLPWVDDLSEFRQIETQ